MLREQGLQSGYDGLCKSLSRQKVEERLGMGMPYTVRLKVSSLIIVMEMALKYSCTRVPLN